LTVDQRKTLMSGIALRADDLTAGQKALLDPMITIAQGDVYVGRYPEPSVLKPGADITELLDQGYGSEFSLTMKSGPENDVWVTGANEFGPGVSEVVSVAQAPAVLVTQQPWTALRYLTATSNSMRLVMQVNPYVKVVETLREFPGPFVAKALPSLPTYLRPGIPRDPALGGVGVARAKKLGKRKSS
jgi:hypothetical protein